MKKKIWTVILALGAINYIFMALAGESLGLDTQGNQPLLFGLSALFLFIIWLMWRKPKPSKQAKQVKRSNSPLEGMVIETPGLRVQYLGGRIYDYGTGKQLSKKQLRCIRQTMELNRDRDRRVASDCLELTTKTMNPDVFFFRYDMLIETLALLSLYHRLFRIPSQSPEPELRRALESRNMLTEDFIRRSHSNMAQKAAALKTEKARCGRYEKYYQEMGLYIEHLSAQARQTLEELKQRDAGYLTDETVETSVAPAPKAVSPVVGKEVAAFSELPFTIPDDVLNLLWIKNGPLCNCAAAEENEPSAIDLSLPLDLSPTENDQTADIGYYPSYERLTPAKRTVYLQWLSDISTPVPIGYVFIFYYGLERFLFTDKYEAALAMIDRLRQSHENSSLFAYSADALLAGCLLHNRPDLISTFDIGKASMDLYLYTEGYLTGRFTAHDLISTCRRWGFTNTRYIKGQPELFETQLTEVLTEKYGSPAFPLAREDYACAERTFTIALANTSLPQDARFAAAKDITSNPDVAQNVCSLLQEAHDRAKRILAEERKKNR